MALFEFLDPGTNGENINYWLSSQLISNSSVDCQSNFNYMDQLHVLKYGQLNIWPSRKLVDETIPKDFKAKYPSIRVIIECTEIRSGIPSSLLLTSELFSSYKHYTTLKGLEEISPKGSFSFIGQLYTASISDREMVERSGFLNLPFSTCD